MKKNTKLNQKKLIVLHGNDEQTMTEVFRRQVMLLPAEDPATAELNTVQLDGQRASMSDLQTAVMSMPFLAQKKLVVIQHAGTFFKTKELQIAFLQMLDTLPPYAVLVVQWYDEGKNRKNAQGQWGFTWDTLTDKHWLAKWIQQHAEEAELLSFALPTQDSLPQWLMDKARAKGGQLSSAGAYALAQAVGADTRMLDLELDKILLYVNYEREATQEDVHLLTSQHQQSSVFDMIDALSNQQYPQAFRLLHKILLDEDAMRVFGMLTRQFRLLLQANELLSEGAREADIARELKQHPFVAKKLSQQARNFQFEQLRGYYQQLQIYDAEIKIGKIQTALAMELFISGLVTDQRS
jgi:DNA polymerase-3 subunit delta